MTMTRPYLRCLRIAFTAFCGLVAVLLIVLWVRSYWWYDALSFSITSSSKAWIFSDRGVLDISAPYRGANWSIRKTTRRLAPDDPVLRVGEFTTYYEHPVRGVYLPYWSLAGMSAALAALPCIRWRFTLRTLLIALTVAAIGLSLIVYAMR